MPAVRDKVSEKERTRNAKARARRGKSTWWAAACSALTSSLQAQKAHRERKAVYIKTLEDKVRVLEQSGATLLSPSGDASPAGPAESLLTEIASLKEENRNLKEALEDLRREVDAGGSSSPSDGSRSSTFFPSPSPPPLVTFDDQISASAFLLVL